MNVFKLSINPQEFYYNVIMEQGVKPTTKAIEVTIDLDEPIVEDAHGVLRPMDKAEVLTALSEIIGKIATMHRWPPRIESKVEESLGEEVVEDEKSLS